MNYPVARTIVHRSAPCGFHVNFGMLLVLVMLGVMLGYLMGLCQQAAQYQQRLNIEEAL